MVMPKGLCLKEKYMKNIAMFAICAALVLPAMTFPLRASGAPAREPGASFNEVEGREWILAEIRSGGETVRIDRKQLEADGMGGFFTVNFQAATASSGNHLVNGMGAPNRFFGPYSVNSNRTLNIGNLASTLMLAFREPDVLKESEYFDYLSKVSRWDLREGRLELYSSNSRGAEIVLVFARE
jgi:heat shock protein HslJ